MFIAFLEHLITSNGNKTLPNKVELILNYPQSKTVQDFQKFLKFFHGFLPNSAQHQVQVYLTSYLKGESKGRVQK